MHKITTKQPCKSCIYTVLELVYKEPSFLVSQTTFSPSSGLYAKSARFFRNESNSQSLCHPSGSHPSLGRWSLPSNRQQRSESPFHGTYHYPQKGELNFWLKIGKFLAKFFLAHSQQAEPGSRWLYIVKWCSFASLQKLRWMLFRELLTKLLLLQVKSFDTITFSKKIQIDTSRKVMKKKVICYQL